MLYGRELTTNSIHFVGEEITFPITGKAKIRYRQEDQDVTVSLLQYPSHLNGGEKLNETETGGSTKYLWKFHEDQRAIAAGQVASFYD